MERKIVRMTGNSSGIIAIARVMPERMLSIILSPIKWSGILKYVTTPTKANSTAAIPAHNFTKLPVCFCKGVGSSGADATFNPIFPYSVLTPIASTLINAEPWVTRVPA
jgi:hypothetical protein